MPLKHSKLTSLMVDYVKLNFDTTFMAIWADLEEYAYCEKEVAYIENNPIPLNAYPDLRAIDEFSDPNIHIIGEAKTERDYLNRNLEAEIQMDVYINVLKTKQKPFLIYSVPAAIRNKVHQDIKNKLIFYNAENINFEVFYR